VAAFNFRQADKVLSFLALDKEDVWVEIADEGVFEGKEAVTAFARRLSARSRSPAR